MLSDEDKLRPFIEVSGRKGFGVKADDLLDKLIAAAKAEVDERQRGVGGSRRGGDWRGDCGRGAATSC